RPSPENSRFPKPVPDALQTKVTRPFVEPTLSARAKDVVGRVGGAAIDGLLDLITAAIPDRALFGSADRPRHTNWYVQKKAIAALRLGDKSLADLLSVLKLAKTRDNAD